MLNMDDVIHATHELQKKRDFVKRLLFKIQLLKKLIQCFKTFSEGRQHRGPLPSKFSGHTGAVCGLKVSEIIAVLNVNAQHQAGG